MVPDVYQDAQHVDRSIRRPTQHGYIFLTTDERDYFESQVHPLQLNDNLDNHFQNAWFHANTIMDQIIDARCLSIGLCCLYICGIFVSEVCIFFCNLCVIIIIIIIIIII